MFRELQGGSILWQEVQVHAEEIHGEFPVEIMELISILTELLLKVLFINLGKVMQIEGALGVDTLVQAKKLTVFFNLVTRGCPQ